MKMVVVLGSLVTMLAVAGPARAQLATEPGSAELVKEPEAETGQTSSSLDVDLKLGLKSFRLGGRLFGARGYAGGAWLNGETRPDGFSLDGRIERDGKAHNFKFNADIDEWVRRAVRWWSVTDL
jgi:hypothetical protein